MTPRRKRSPNISQVKLKPAIRSYLTQLQRDPSAIKLYKKGYCAGFSILALYAMFLEDQQLEQLNSNPTPSDNWDWFLSTAQLLATWDRQLESLTPKNRDDIERFISLVTSFHHARRLFHTKQSDIGTSLEDSHGNRPRLEYTLGGLFLIEDLTRRFKLTPTSPTTSILETLCAHPHRLILITSINHMTSLYVANATKNTLYLYDSNNPIGRQKYSLKRPQALAKAILADFKGSDSTPAPLTIRIYTMDDTLAAYPEAFTLLTKANPGSALSTYKSHRAVDVGLLMATRAKSEGSIDYYLKNGADLDTVTLGKHNKKRSPYQILLTHYPMFLFKPDNPDQTTEKLINKKPIRRVTL